MPEDGGAAGGESRGRIGVRSAIACAAALALLLPSCFGSSPNPSPPPSRHYPDPHDRSACIQSPPPVAGDVRSAAAPAPGPKLPLRTEGAHVVDSSGRRVKLASVNWYGADSDDHVPEGLNLRPVDAIAHEIKALGFNSVRLTWSNYLLECDPVVDPATVKPANPQYVGRRALSVFDDVVRALTEQGVMVVLDDHSSDPGFNVPESDDGLWYNARYSEQQWIDDWTTMAGRFRGIDHVVGADLRNEPSRHAGVQATWGDGSANDWRRAAMVAGDAVLRANPDLLIAVEGIGSGADLSAADRAPIVLRRNCPGAGCREVTDKLVYSPHAYSFYQGNEVDSNYDELSSLMHNQWGKLAQGPDAHPVWVGEFGTCNTSRACVERQPFAPAKCLSSGPGDNGLEGMWFENVTRYIAATDVDWSYWTLNGTTGANDDAPHTPQCYGLLNPGWTGPSNDDLLCALQAIQEPTDGRAGARGGCHTSSYPDAVKADAPLVYYPFDEATASDPVDAEHQQDGKIVGRVEQGQAGVSGDPGDRSIKVAASDGYVEAGGAQALRGSHARTVELWLRTTATAHQSFFDGGSGSHGREFVLALADTTNESGAPEQTPGLYVQMWDSDVYVPGEHLADGSWHYVAVTLDGTKVSIVIDGRTPEGYVWDGSNYTSREPQPFDLPVQPDTAPQTVQVGTANPDAASWAAGFRGSIDDVAIYRSALPVARLMQHFAAARR